MTSATEELRQHEQQQTTSTSTDATITALSLPLGRTLRKVASLSVKTTRNSSRYERDGEFALEILCEAVELTRPWLRIVEKELERLGLDVEEERGRRSGKSRSGGGGGDDGLLAVVPGVANSFLKLLRSSSKGGDGRKVSLLRDMYASVHTNLLSAEEKVARLEREVASKRRKRRKRRAVRAADSDGEEGRSGVSQSQGEEKAERAPSTISKRRRDLAADAADANAGEADHESPSRVDSEIAASAAAVPPSATSIDSSVKRLPRSDSLEAQMTVGDKRSRRSRTASIRPGGSAATHQARVDDVHGPAIAASTKASDARSRDQTGSTKSRKGDSSRGSPRSTKSKGSRAKHRPGAASESRSHGPPEMVLPNIGEVMAKGSENRSRESRTDRKSAGGARSRSISREHGSLEGGAAASTYGDLEEERLPMPSPSSSPLHDDVQSHSYSAIGNRSASRGGKEADVEYERCSPSELSSMLKAKNLGRHGGSPCSTEVEDGLTEIGKRQELQTVQCGIQRKVAY
ncbi:Hypothetical predicted protein [Lecanosticta acicola]|uniref:Uncharacterized protein n=1 Tax=Lecanosticta acicola TaxID=111012 RepID=A0AAI8Z922_9PEZI|nr:Hypothetical predicted protein [Lecanosticta acicola]